MLSETITFDGKTIVSLATTLFDIEAIFSAMNDNDPVLLVSPD